MAQQSPTVSVNPAWANSFSNQNLTLTTNVLGAIGDPTPTGVITVMSNNPAPQVHDTFRHSNGTLMNGLVTQSGNSVWITLGSGIGEVEDNHLVNAAPSGNAGALYASLANTVALNGTPQLITTVGGAIRMCPSATGTYDPAHTSAGLFAVHDLTFGSSLELGFGPTTWWVEKQVNSVHTTILTGTQNVRVDCSTAYTVAMVINPVEGTLQVIPPSGIPSAVISDPDIIKISALYGAWEMQNNAPDKYIGEWESVWMGGGSTMASAALIDGNASIQIPAGSLALGSNMLTLDYVPDAGSAALYTSASGHSDISVQDQPGGSVTPSVTVQPLSPSATLAQPAAVTVTVSGPPGLRLPTGTVMLMASEENSGTFPVIYDTFQYPDGTALSSQMAQSGNSQWSWTGGDQPTIHGMRLDPMPNAAHEYYASLANLSVPGNAPSPVTALGATFQLCLSPGATSYDPNAVSLTILAQHDTSVSDYIHFNFGPGWWALSKRVNGSPYTTFYQGAQNLAPDCTTTYAAEMLLDPVAGTVQVIPPNGIPSPVIADPDVSTVNALYGTWESGSGTTCNNCAFAAVSSVWVGGGYLAPAAVLNSGSAIFTIPSGALPVGVDTLTASYTPDAESAAAFTSATGSGGISVSLVTPSISVSPAASPITTAEPVSVTITVAGPGDKPLPAGSVTLAGAGFESPAMALQSGSATFTIPAATLALGSDTLTASYAPDVVSAPFYSSATQTGVIAVNVPPGFALAASPATLSVVQGSSAHSIVSIAAVGGFMGQVSLTASGLPSGVTASFASGTAAGTQAVTFAAAASTPLTTAPVVVTITGKSGALSAKTQMDLSIAGAPGFTGTQGTTSLSIAAGATTGNTVPIGLLGTYGFAGTVSLSCTVTFPMAYAIDAPKCSLNPDTLTVSATAARNTMLAVTTTAPTSASGAARRPAWLPAGGAALALLVLWIVPRSRRRWPLLVAIAACGGLLGTMGCSRSFADNHQAAAGLGTTTGVYTVTVTGASGSLSATVATIKLTVQ